ncbi:MAG: hypothetical protein K8F91_02575, partial [Candidatus Obscuribacterales bacterium]|nr:hypothetical protein [Candidatus Obscuribacterales bacterium]
LKQCTTLRLEKQIALRKEDYELLAKLPIEKLYLIGCNLTDEKLHVISKIKSLKGLYIDCSSAEFKSPNQISSKGIEALTRLPQLDYLALSRLPIDDSCLEPIGKSRTIKRISILTCQNIEGSGFKYLQDHDFDRVTLRQLKLSQRAVSNLAKIKINHLLLHSMDIDAALTNGLNQSKSMKELALESCKIKIGALQKLTRIPTLAIIQGQNGEKANEPTPLPAEVVDGIKCKNLTIEGGHITQKLARTLSMQKNRYLQLITVHIRFDELKIICRGKSLKRLKLVKVPGLKLKDAFALKKQFPDLKIDISHF